MTKSYQPPFTITPAIICLISNISEQLGCLWQTLILSQWNPLLAQLPVESMIHAQQSEYYQAFNLSTQKTDSAPFIEFMLGVISETIVSNAGSNTP